MTQEQKDLLLKGLCVRMPYGVKCADIHADEKLTNKWDVVAIDKIFGNEFSHVCISNCEKSYGYKIPIERIKPYLFPMSSITKDIEDEIYHKTGLYDIFEYAQIYIEDGGNFVDICKLFEILNKHHIDYNGWIGLGLAIDTTGLNIY